MKRVLFVVVALVLAVGVWWSRPRDVSGVVLISIDTLRADHLGAYGYPLDTSPFFDEFAQRGTLFEQARVQLPGTLPSHMSIFTGLYPREHGVYPPDSVLSESIPTLPELFQQAGYRTAAFSEGGYVAGRYGFSRGFDVYDDITKDKPGGAAETVRRALEFVDDLGRDDRFFIFLHTYEVHDPYMAPDGYGSWEGAPPDVWEPTGRNLARASRGELEIDREGIEYFVSLYDSSLRFVDDQLRRFMEALWGVDSAGEVWVVITSDHGEEFREHGGFAHHQIYNETLHVPLLIRRLDQRRGTRVPSLVESVDIAPTLLELAGIDAAPLRLSGRSLAPLLDNPDLDFKSRAYAEGYSHQIESVFQQRDDGLYQLVVNRHDGERVELFNLSEDPYGAEDLARRRRVLTHEMKGLLGDYHLPPRAQAGREPLDEEQIERLQALGYLE